MADVKRTGRTTRSSAAAAASPSVSQGAEKQEEDEDAALPAQEEELAIGSEDEDEGEEGSDSADEMQESEEAGDREDAASEDEGEDQGEEDEEAEEAGDEDDDEDDEDEGEAEGEGDAAADEEQPEGTADEQQQQVRQQSQSVKTAPKNKGGRPPKNAAAQIAGRHIPAPKKDYSAVLQLPPEEQHALVVEAEKIRRFRHSARAVPVCPEPKRNKTHWDHLLDEAEWMAKEFQRERAWKIKQAKRFVRAVKASKKDVESRAEVRAQEELSNLRKRAVWISKQVQGFWKKAERVVNYKIYVAIETRKRAVLDQHLDMIVGQTEAFSKMLAQNLVGPQAEQQQQQQQVPALLPAPTDGAGSMQLHTPQQQQQQQQQDVKLPSKDAQLGQEVKQEPSEEEDAEDTVAALAGDLLMDDEPTDEVAAGLSHQKRQQQQQQQQLDGVIATPQLAASKKRRRSSSGTAAADGESTMASEDDEPVAERPRSKRKRNSTTAVSQQPSKSSDAASKKGKAPAAASGDVDFKSDEEASDDDEATLEEEERLAEGDNNNDDELEDLDAEANMPIEELLAKYGFVVPDEDAEQQHHESDDEEEEEEEEDEEQQQQQQQQSKAAGAGQQEAERKQPAAADADTSAAANTADQQQVQESEQQSAELQQQDKSEDAAAEDDAEGEAMVAASRDAAAAQPTGFTLATTKVKTPIPFLLKNQLREYQHIGLDWLVSLYEKRINGILADEMGLGKTIQTVALLAYLACEEGVWGPHLVVVPTSVMLNWEMEFKKWCPAFKLLTYYGTAKERKQKRQGWSKPHAFHVCITSYTLVLQDAKMFRRKKWRYLILDEAHMIKNWKSQRWQTLLRFNSKRRLLITGTPLQNDLMELWSLMHFLMPAVFSSHAQFKDWFSNPLTGAVETGQEVSGQLVERLHGVLRPFLLRRLKSEVEKQMPAKHEHILTCRLSKRQRQLYDEYMARAETRAVMSGGNFMGVINVLMQLRKVCNHPDLFEGRPIISAYDMPPLSVQLPTLAMNIVPDAVDTAQQLSALGLLPAELTGKTAVWEAQDIAQLAFRPEEFAAVVAEAAVDPAGFAKDAGPLYSAAAEAAVQAGLVLPPDQAAAATSVGGRGMQGRGNSSAALAAVAQATDAVRQSHAQLMMTSGAAVALSGVLAQQWQRHSSWRLSRAAHAASLSLQRCGVDFPSSLQLQGPTSLMNPGQLLLNGPTVSGGWLPVDACGQPVGASSTGRFPDAAAFGSTAAFRSRFLAAAGNAISRCSSRSPVCGWDLLRVLSGAAHPVAACLKGRMSATASADLPSLILEVSPTYEERAAAMEEVLCWFKFVIPRARARPVDAWCCKPDGLTVRRAALAAAVAQQEFFKHGGSLRTALVRGQLFFPDRRLLQYDCGKLIELDALLRRLKAGGHRALIFTQMAKMLDVLEAFLNLHGHTYMRLDGSTKPEQRQVMMQRFNTDTKYFVFILSTRSGGVGINLTGADTVIFYDSDWNPAMDQQAQDRCHRIGQTREVHIYRLISNNTIEENILRKSDQKRQLDWLAIQSGGFNTDMLAKLNLGGGAAGALSADDLRAALRQAEDEDDAAAAAVAEREAEADMAEFTAEPPPEELKDEEMDGEGDEPTGIKTGTRAGTPVSVSTVAPPRPKGKQHHKKGSKHTKASGVADGGDDDGRAGSPAPIDSDKADGDKSGADGSKEAADGAEAEPDAEEEARDLVAKDLAGLQEGQSGHDLLARLSSSLSPIELYAVRHLESLRPVDVEAAAAAAVEDIKKEEWDLDAIEKRKEQQEAEAEDSEEVIEGWDKAEATAAYQAYQEQIAAVLAAEEEAAAAAAAAAAEEAEMMQLTEADLAGTGGRVGGSYTYSGRAAYDTDHYSQQGYPDDGHLEVTSPGRGGPGRPKREQWGWNANLPPLGGHWQQQQPFKKQKGMFDAAAAGGFGRGGRGRGRGRGRVGRGGFGSGYNQGIKDDSGDYYYGDDYFGEDDSANTAYAWQMLEDGGSISSHCWLTPAAEEAVANQQDAAAAVLSASSNLLPWEPTWDVPLVQIVADIAAHYAMSDPSTAAAAVNAAAAEAAAANFSVDLEAWGMFQWDHIAEQLKQQLAPPMPRTALHCRVTGASCKARYLQLLKDFRLLLDMAVELDKQAQQNSNTGAAAGSQQQQQPPTANGPSSGIQQFVALPAVSDEKVSNVMQQMQPAALQLLQSVVNSTTAHAAAVAAEWQRCQVAAAAATKAAPSTEEDQSQSHHVVKVSQMQQLASEVETVAQSAAEAASRAAAAATAAVAGISTRRQSEGVRQAVGGPTALVLAPSAAQMASIMEENDAGILGAGSTVVWGAEYAAAAVMSPTLLRAVSGAAAAAARQSNAALPAAAVPLVKTEPYSDVAIKQDAMAVAGIAQQPSAVAAAGYQNTLAAANGQMIHHAPQQAYTATGKTSQAGLPQQPAAAAALGGGAAVWNGENINTQHAAGLLMQQQFEAAGDVYQAAASRAGSVPPGSNSELPVALQQHQQQVLQPQQMQQQQQALGRHASPSPVPQLLLQQQAQLVQRASASPSSAAAAGGYPAAALAALQQQQQHLLQQQQAGGATPALLQNQIALLLAQQQIQQQYQAQLQQQGNATAAAWQLGAASQPIAQSAASAPIGMPLAGTPGQLAYANPTAAGVNNILPQVHPPGVSAPAQQSGVNPGFITLTPAQLLQLQQQQQLAAITANGQLPQQHQH